MENAKKILTDQCEQLIAELKTIAVQNTETGDWVAVPETTPTDADPNVTADNVEDWNERRALMAQLETRYHNVKLALTKFETGTYGQCEICNEEVETSRLTINPAARTCQMHLERERELPL